MSPLISATELHAKIGAPDVVVVDCRQSLADANYGRSAYATGHIPGAAFLHLDEDLSGPLRDPGGRFRGRHPLPDRVTFTQRLANIGLTSTGTLVAYDDGDSMVAARLWWLARWIGHDRVAVLDGGLKAWRSQGYATDTALPLPRTGTLRAGAALVHTVEADALLAHMATDPYRIVDARAAERYRGDVEPLDTQAGHIPGALNHPFRANLRDDETFKPPAQLRADFERLLADVPLQQVVHQCGSGVSACHNLLAMQVADMPGALLYPGSWSEWSSDPSRPIAIGGTP